MNIKKIGSSLILSAVIIGGGAMISQPAFAQSNGTATAPQAVRDAIAQAEATINELDGLAIVALAVALTPFGAMLALRFLNMVLSRV